MNQRWYFYLQVSWKFQFETRNPRTCVTVWSLHLFLKLFKGSSFLCTAVLFCIVITVSINQQTTIKYITISINGQPTTNISKTTTSVMARKNFSILYPFMTWDRIFWVVLLVLHPDSQLIHNFKILVISMVISIVASLIHIEEVK